jgi:hypothetical protein
MNRERVWGLERQRQKLVVRAAYPQILYSMVSDCRGFEAEKPLQTKSGQAFTRCGGIGESVGGATHRLMNEFLCH